MKKKIISVVLVMTMVFALLAVSASARPAPPTSIERVTLTGVPTSLSIGDSVDTITAAIQPGNNEYSILYVQVKDANSETVTGTISTAGTYTINVTLESQGSFSNDTVFPEGTEHVLNGAPAHGVLVKYAYTVEEPQVDPDPEPDPTPDPDFDGLFSGIFNLIRWKKVTDDVKTFSILSIIFKLVEEIVAKLAAYIKK